MEMITEEHRVLNRRAHITDFEMNLTSDVILVVEHLFSEEPKESALEALCSASPPRSLFLELTLP